MQTDFLVPLLLATIIALIAVHAVEMPVNQEPKWEERQF